MKSAMIRMIGKGGAMVLALSAGLAMAGDVKVTLSGANEVPPVTTTAAGTGMFTIGTDMSVNGSITTTGVKGTAAHIHEAAAGANGPVIVPLTKDGDKYSTAAGAKLTEAQYKSFLAGNLYVNVHSEANKPGEIRAQLKP